MSYLKTYRQFSNLLQRESYEPLIGWGMRMGIAGTVPLLWGLYTSHVIDSVWIALTAEAVSWVEMKGSFAWRVRTLFGGALLAILFSILGTVSGVNVWFSVAGMLLVGFIATLLKSIGDRASGLALCVYLMFIISNGYPVAQYAGILHRAELVAIGATWPVVLGIAFSLLMPAEQPYRRQIALIWRSVAELAAITVAGIQSNDAVKTRADLYQKEKDVRTAIDNSYQFYGQMAYQVRKQDNRQYQLAMVRKAAGLVAVTIIAIGDEMEPIFKGQADDALRLRLGTLFNTMKEAVTRLSVFVLTLQPEEKLLAVSQIGRMKSLATLIRQSAPSGDNAVSVILKHTDRAAKLLESAIQRIEQMGGDQPVYRTYSLIKTSFLLQPKYLYRNVLGLFNFSTMTARYAIRSAVAAGLAMFLYKWFHIDHGYWLPFSVMIVKQPYFGATLKRARQRVAGTVLGVIAGGLLLRIPAVLHVKDAILFLTFVLMVYFLRKQYAVAAFIITINLVLLFNIESAYNDRVMLARVLCTLGGAGLAVASGFMLLPTWDRQWFTKHLAGAIQCNYEYFRATFYSATRPVFWTRFKRSAESKNSNVFDSFNRYLGEPGVAKNEANKAKNETFYGLVTCNVRITRNLNNIHIEQDYKKQAPLAPSTAAQQARINECLTCFNEVLQQLPTLALDARPVMILPQEQFRSPFLLNDAQVRSVEKIIIELKAMKDGLGKV